MDKLLKKIETLGLKAVILEKGKIAGPRPRGEGIGHYPLLDDILGEDFIQTVSQGHMSLYSDNKAPVEVKAAHTAV